MGNKQATGPGISSVDQRSSHGSHSNHEGGRPTSETRTKVIVGNGPGRVEMDEHTMTKTDQSGHKTKKVIERTVSGDIHSANGNKLIEFAHIIKQTMSDDNDNATAKIDADILKNKLKEISERIERTMSDDSQNANRSNDGGQSVRDGEWQPARQRGIEASEQMEAKAKSLIREGRDGISRTLPATSRQDEDLLKKAVANKGALMAAGGGLAMALVLGLNKKGKKRAMWPLVVFPAVGFAIGTAYQANKTSKAIASSSSDSDFANQIRNIRNGNKPVEGHKTTTHLGHGPDGRKTV